MRCVLVCFFFFFKQKTAYEMRISDWSSDVCSSDLYGNTNPLYDGYTFITTAKVPGDAVNIRGVEIEFNHAMTWLPSPLDGLSVRGSFMYNDPDEQIVRVAVKVGPFSLSFKKGPACLFVNSVWKCDTDRSKKQ